MLCITKDEKMTYITIGGLDDIQVSTFSWTPQYNIALSWNLLAWISSMEGIPRSFTNFITTPELSGPFYISSNIYHTQITEYSLLTIFLHHYSQWVFFFSSSNVFLIDTLLVPPPFIFTIAISVRTGPLRGTFPMLFQLKWFFIYSDQFLQIYLYIPPNTPENWCVLCWRLLLNGFRSVLVNAIDNSSN